MARHRTDGSDDSKGDQQTCPRPREGRVARVIEEQTVNIPSEVFLYAAGASIAGALLPLECVTEDNHERQFSTGADL